MRRKKSGAAAAVILTAVLTACGTGKGEVREPEPVILSVLAGQSTSDAGIEDMINEWMAQEYPEVILEWECVDWGDSFSSKIQGRFAAGDIPDIIIGKAQDVQTYARTRNLGEIPEQCSGKIESWALDTVASGGKVYEIPYNAWYQGVIYNKGIFEELNLEPPETEEEMDQVIKRLKEAGIVPFAAHFQESWKAANMTMQYMTNELFRDIPDWGDQFREGKQDFSGNEVIRRCFENNRKILQNSWEDALQIDQFESDSRFTQGEAAMYLTGSWSMQFASQYGEDQEFGIFPYPSQNGDAYLIRETNLTFMKSADSEYGDLIDDIFFSLLTEKDLAQEILAFTQSSSVIKGITPGYDNKLQNDIDWYIENDRVTDVSVGNSQLMWEFQDKVAVQQLLWLKNELPLESVLRYADENRKYSSYGSW